MGDRQNSLAGGNPSCVCPVWFMFLMGPVLYFVALLFCAWFFGMIISGVGHRLEIDKQNTEKRRQAEAKAAEERQAKEMDELYKARPEWGFKPNTPHQP